MSIIITKQYKSKLPNYILDRNPIFVESSEVQNSVICDVYSFDTLSEISNSDLGIVVIESDYSTPLQRILTGEKTIEGHISGSDYLVVDTGTLDQKKFEVQADCTFEITLNIGQTMQWFSTSDLVIYEICYPKYSDGRFKIINNQMQ